MKRAILLFVLMMAALSAALPVSASPSPAPGSEPIVHDDARVTWLLAAMLRLVPPDRLQHSYVPEARESLEQTRERYVAIAEAIRDVAWDPNEQPLWTGRLGRARTASVLLSLAYHESGFRRDVDLGIGRARLARQGWNDHGRSWCVLQINLGRKPVAQPDGTMLEQSARMTEEGWSGRDLIADRDKCMRAGFHIVRRSLSTCASLPFYERLSSYAGGDCAKDESKGKSIVRLRTAKRIMEYQAPPSDAPAQAAAAATTARLSP
jgi:hypothetical protein